ncbi:hypothetical protein Q7W10_03790 [Streptococcus suis]|nr:hypothetical protein [Streptococcus suis]
MTKTATLTVTKLLTEDEYIVPLYQRNFSWTYDEIEQLLIDIADAYNERENRPDYYIISEHWLFIKKEICTILLMDNREPQL